jgi:hypothetical protein
MIHDKIYNILYTASVEALDKHIHVLQSSIRRMDCIIVRDIIPYIDL